MLNEAKNLLIFNLTFHCTDHRALCKVFLHERVYTENRNGCNNNCCHLQRIGCYRHGIMRQCLCNRSYFLLWIHCFCQHLLQNGLYRLQFGVVNIECSWTSRSSDLLRYTVQLRRLPVYLTEAWFSGKSERIRSRPVWLTLPGRSSCFSA